MMNEEGAKEQLRACSNGVRGVELLRAKPGANKALSLGRVGLSSRVSDESNLRGKWKSNGVEGVASHRSGRVYGGHGGQGRVATQSK